MDTRLSRLIADYQASVKKAVELMAASGIERPASNDQWVSLDIPQIGKLHGGVPYFKHGYGCSIHLPGEAVDFDFGAHGQIDGFSASRLQGYAGPRLTEYGFYTVREMQEAFEEATNSALLFSGDQLYYLSAINDERDI